MRYRGVNEHEQLFFGIGHIIHNLVWNVDYLEDFLLLQKFIGNRVDLEIFEFFFNGVVPLHLTDVNLLLVVVLLPLVEGTAEAEDLPIEPGASICEQVIQRVEVLCLCFFSRFKISSDAWECTHVGGSNVEHWGLATLHYLLRAVILVQLEHFGLEYGLFLFEYLTYLTHHTALLLLLLWVAVVLLRTFIDIGLDILEEPETDLVGQLEPVAGSGDDGHVKVLEDWYHEFLLVQFLLDINRKLELIEIREKQDQN